MTMPGSFNEEFGDDEPVLRHQRAGAPQIQFRQPPPVVVVPPDPMIEVQRRLDMAACYQVLVAETCSSRRQSRRSWSRKRFGPSSSAASRRW
jgi:hypothetical protein